MPRRLDLAAPILVSLVSVLAGFAMTSCAAQRPDVRSPAAESPIAWQPWAPESFAQAAREDKIVLVDVGIEGCTACRWMDEKTYHHADVQSRLNRNFVAISVDAEAQPDVGERYSSWGWPATIFLAPDGTQLLAIRGNKLPQNFIPILDELLARKAAGTLTADNAAPIDIPDSPTDDDVASRRDQAVAQMDRAFDPELGAWGRKGKSPIGANLEHAFLRAHIRGEEQWREGALMTLAGHAKTIDPVWGGVFVASLDGYVNIIPEKRTIDQAEVLGNFARAYRITQDASWLEAAADVRTYLEEWMRAGDGSFYSTQEDDAPNLGPEMSARDYYALSSDAARREFGLPPIDHAVYTHKNALVISAYVDLFEVAHDVEVLEVATTAAAVMLGRQRPDGLFEQFVDSPEVRKDKRIRTLPDPNHVYLLPQGPMGQALLDLYRVTADEQYRVAAIKLADGLTHLEDGERGGYYARDEAPMDALLPRRKPLPQNASAARFLLELSLLTKVDAYKVAATRAVKAVSDPQYLSAEGSRVGELALALEALLDPGVEFSVVGGREDARAQALYQAALDTYEPRKVVHYEAPGRYPDRGEPTLYVCTDQACSSPISDPSKVAPAAAAFVGR